MNRNTIKVTVLGCGGSSGVPLIGNNWGKCDPNNPKNRRLRPAILIESGETVILVDSGPDIREQLLRADLKDLTAVIFTHAHADHSHGIDDLRSINWMLKRPIPIYAYPSCLAELRQKFGYIFDKRSVGAEWIAYLPDLVPHEITTPALKIGDMDLRFFPQDHNRVSSLGIRVGGFAYSTDTRGFTEEGWAILAGIDTWLVDCTREVPHHAHAHLDLTLEWVKRLKPRMTYLTHMDHTMDYDTLARKLPPGVIPAYDGLTFEIPA